MEELIAQLRNLLSGTMKLYYKAHVMHWNVEGADFPQYHDFFGDVYDELFAAIDPVAEHMRFLGAKTPGSLGNLLTASTIADAVADDADFESMVRDFQEANNGAIEICRAGIAAADDANEPAVGNFLRHHWSILKNKQ